MESYTKEVKTVTLVLNENEARWLKALIRNPKCEDINKVPFESNIDCEMRKRFWKALKETKYYPIPSSVKVFPYR